MRFLQMLTLLQFMAGLSSPEQQNKKSYKEKKKKTFLAMGVKSLNLILTE